MKIIGTGLSGLVGSRIVELLQGKHQFVDFSLDSGIDITDFDKLKSAFTNQGGAKIVLHLAAFTDVDAAFRQNGDKDGICYRVNVTGTENIAKLCAETGKYLIHVSTDFVFDGNKDGQYSEEDVPRPIEWYGQTKLWAEEKVKESGCRYVIFRLAFPYKAKPSPPNLEPKVKPDLVRKIKQKLEKGEEVKSFTDQIITPTFIDDITQVMEYVFNHQPDGIYHMVGSTSLSPYELAQKVAQVFGLNQQLVKPISLVEYLKSDPRSRQKQLAITNTKLQQEFGIEMKTVDRALEIMKLQLTNFVTKR